MDYSTKSRQIGRHSSWYPAESKRIQRQLISRHVASVTMPPSNHMKILGVTWDSHVSEFGRSLFLQIKALRHVTASFTGANISDTDRIDKKFHRTTRHFRGQAFQQRNADTNFKMLLNTAQKCAKNGSGRSKSLIIRTIKSC